MSNAKKNRLLAHFSGVLDILALNPTDKQEGLLCLLVKPERFNVPPTCMRERRSRANSIFKCPEILDILVEFRCDIETTSRMCDTASAGDGDMDA